jgi:hypothetical protein
LQVALAALVADRTIKRVIDQQELDHAFTTIGDCVCTTMFSATGIAQDATGLGVFSISTRHIRQLPAIDSRSWKQKRGTSAPASSHACMTVEPAGTSTVLPSTTSFGMPRYSAAAGDFAVAL